MQPFGTRFAGT